MQLSQNQEILSDFLAEFSKYTSNLEHFEKEDEPQGLFISEILDCKKPGYFNG